VIKDGTLEVNLDGRKQVAAAGSMVLFGVNENENMAKHRPAHAEELNAVSGR
jgi:hypothetical protein